MLLTLRAARHRRNERQGGVASVRAASSSMRRWSVRIAAAFRVNGRSFSARRPRLVRGEWPVWGITGRSHPSGESDRSRRQSCHPPQAGRAADQDLPLYLPGQGRYARLRATSASVNSAWVESMSFLSWSSSGTISSICATRVANDACKGSFRKLAASIWC